MAVPNSAYNGRSLNDQKDNIIVHHQEANITDSIEILKQRFFLDDVFINQKDGVSGFIGCCYPTSSNYFMHTTNRIGSLAKYREITSGNGDWTSYKLFNDGGLNTLGLPFHLSSEGNAVNYIEFTVGILQPWYGSVSSCKIELWAGGSQVISITLDLADPIPNYNFDEYLDFYSPALDITRARAYKVLLTPALDSFALDNMSYELRYKMGNENGYTQYLKYIDFPLSSPVSTINVANRPTGSCSTSGEINTKLFNEIKRIRLLPNQDLPPRIWYVEPNGIYAWQADDPNDDTTIFYVDSFERDRANGYFYGRWGNYITTITNGLITNRTFCQPPLPALPPRDAGRFSVIIENVVRNGNTATVTYTVVRDLTEGGDAGEVGVTVRLSDGVGGTTNTSLMSENATTVQSVVSHQIKNADFNGVSGTLFDLLWYIS